MPERADSSGPSPEQVFYMIPSEERVPSPGWEAFLRARPTLLREPRRSTFREMRILHRLTTHGIELPPMPQHIAEDCAVQILLRDANRNFIFQLLKKSPGTLSGLLRPGGAKVIPGMEHKVFIPRRGHLRMLGKRRKGVEEEWENVYGPHTKPYFRDDGDRYIL